MKTLKTFKMQRQKDETGVSGVGTVCWGVVFPTKKVVIAWNPKIKTPVSSINIFDSFTEFKKVHIDSHPTNGTKIIWTK